MITTVSMKSRYPEAAVTMRALLSATVLITLALCRIAAAEFEGEVKIGASRTDNIRLATSPNEEEETIYQVIPRFSYSKETARFATDIYYRLEHFRYKELDDSATYHQFDGKMQSQIIQDALTLEIGASRTQSIIDPDQVLPPGNLPITTNITDRDEIFASPWLTTALGSSATLSMGYAYTDVRYTDGDLQDHNIQFARFGLDNYRRGRGLTWAARYLWNETDYEFSLPWEYQQASLELGFWANDSMRIFASGGKESAWDDFVDRSLQDPFWDAGFAYKAGEQIEAEFAIGERSFGDSWRGSLDWKFKRGDTRFSYSETPTTIGNNRFSRGGLAEPDEPDDFLDRPGSAERFISKRLQWNLNINLRKTDIRFVVFDEDRAGRTRADGSPLPDERQRGANVGFDWQLGTRTDLNILASFLNRESEDLADTDSLRISTELGYKVGQKSRLALQYSHSDEQPSLPTSGRDYVANVAALFFTYSF